MLDIDLDNMTEKELKNLIDDCNIALENIELVDDKYDEVLSDADSFIMGVVWDHYYEEDI
jgi:hypothetical protein